MAEDVESMCQHFWRRRQCSHDPLKNVAPSFLVNILFLPDYAGNKVFFAKHFVHDGPKIVNLMVSNADKNNAIVAQKVFCQFQTRVNHVEPIGMKATAGISVSS